MRCKACNTQLSDSESVRKDAQTEEYYDLCTPCFLASEWAIEESNDDFLFQNGITELDTN